MALITFIDHNDQAFEVNATEGVSVMQAAVENGIDGIVAECGGACSCATCHVYVEEAWVEKTGQASDIEKDMLECVLEPAGNSRLCCQIEVTNDLDGLIVRMPASQY